MVSIKKKNHLSLDNSPPQISLFCEFAVESFDNVVTSKQAATSWRQY